MDFELVETPFMADMDISGRVKLCRMKNNLIMTRKKTHSQALHGKTFSTPTGHIEAKRLKSSENITACFEHSGDGGM